MKRLTPEEKYRNNLRKQEKILEDFAAHETEFAEDLMYWYKLRKEEIPDDEYRACAFFINKEYLIKKGSLTLLYEVYLRCCRELPDVTKETAFDLLCFRYALYAKTLETGGYNGGTDWR
jgi:hypothetical protein